jgi:hypothetical protein
MIASTRRGFAAGLLGLGTGGGAAMHAPLAAANAVPLRLPEEPLRLLRVLERGLPDRAGAMAAITVRRWWEVTFERRGRGIVMLGRQVAAEVDAPPRLAEIAAIEQRRDASGLFPLMLSGEGTILTAPALPPESDLVGAALRTAETLIARHYLPAAERARISLYLAEVHRAGAGLLDALPGDLMFPAREPMVRSEAVALPGGLSGHFTLHYAATPQADAPWLARAERRMETVIGRHRRRAAETWVLGPASA